MLLGALLAAGAPRPWLEDLPVRLGLAGVRIDIQEVDRGSVRAVKVNVLVGDTLSREPEGPHGSGYESEHPHRHVGQLLRLVEQAPLSAWVRDRACQAFRLLGEAEGRVHGVPAERVSLHEVGALDALVDIVGGIEGFEQLGIDRIFSLPVALGSGWVRAAHGKLPVPAPATTLLLEGVVVATDGPVEGEATTPTGAALLRVLSEGPPPSRWRPERSGWGAGSRDPQGYPNALRLMIVESAAEAAEIMVLAADLDDMSPEYLEPLRSALMAAGAVDVQMWATLMKKGRIGFRVEALTPAGGESRLADAFFANSTTAGVRWHRASRATLARRHLTLEDQAGSAIRVKVLEGPAGLRVKPEYEDVIAAARRTGQPALEIAEAARRVARARLPGEDPDHRIAHKESQ